MAGHVKYTKGKVENEPWNLLQTINIVLEDVQGKKVALALHRGGQDVRQLVDSLPSEK